MPNSSTIYADYQATTPVEPSCGGKDGAPLARTVWQSTFRRSHRRLAGRKGSRSIQDNRCRLLGGDPDEIIFTSGATEANNLALFGLARRAPPGQRRILVGATEHKCVLAAARALEARENFIVGADLC